jgi:superfamily II RNA helicase
MVKICSVESYPSENEEMYKEYFDKFSYPLHTFQKWAIEGIIEGHHVLACCPTGSGKSLPAEFSLDFFNSKGKKVIYASPIKSLSNQKFNDFKQKYPNITIGIVTGDIKINTNADVLVMTTEILLNKLYQIKSDTQINCNVSFDMDIENELGCVIFDEIHLINDENRGTVWENSIMMLPKHVQMVGLSATLDNPEKFAHWLETKGETTETENKVVYLTSKKVRAVPLIHYSFITTNQSIFKLVKDKTVQEEIKSLTNKPFVIQEHNGNFKEEQYFKINKMLNLFQTKDVRIKRQHVLNEVTKYMTENEMTPAICYVFSIKKIEECSREVTTNLLEFDSKVPYIAKRECETILRRLPNFEEYLRLPEYVTLVSLLEKGIATHHSKMLPILREIVEIFFAKGYIKLLFATETVAIGLNLPVRTCLFTDVYKHDGTNMRVLYGHEYTQAAGRAGRLGLDTVGHVIHLNNLFRNIEPVSYKNMMNGTPQKLVSKFKISYNLLLNLIDTQVTDMVAFIKRSMISGDIEIESNTYTCKRDEMKCALEKLNECIKHLRTPKDIVDKYLELHKNIEFFTNKKKKETERVTKQMIEDYKFLKGDLVTFQKVSEKEKEIKKMEEDIYNLHSFFDISVDTVINLLHNESFTERIDNTIILTLKGKIGAQLKEMNCLVFSDILFNKELEGFTSVQLAVLFSCFTNLSIEECFKDNEPKTDDCSIKTIIKHVSDEYNRYKSLEILHNINAGIDYTLQYDLIIYIEEWCTAEDVESCKLILQRMREEKHIFLGEFVKCVLKITNISTEMEKIAEMMGNISFLNRLKEIPEMLLKYVVTNQSLYI